MAADTTYVVAIELQTKGSLGDKGGGSGGDGLGLDKAAGKAKSLETRLNGVSSAMGGLSTISQATWGKFIGAADWAVGKVWGLTKAIAMVGAAAGFGLITAGVFKFNKELENSKISLAAIFTGNNMVGDLNSGLDLADSTIVKMREDAAKLPGEFSDLLNIMTTTAIPAFQAGMGVEGLREMSSKLMATGVVASMPLDMVAREAAQLMSGRAGGHNVLGQRLMGLHGDAAKEFNELSAADRLAKINTELEKYGGAIDKFATSFEGLSSTAVDTAKEWIRQMSAPLFEKIKGALIEISAWVEDRQHVLEMWAREWGEALSKAWDWGKRTFLEWFPLLKDFLSVAWDRFSKMWTEMQPAAKSIADSLKEALKDPNGTIDKLILLAKIYAGAKIGGGIVGTLGTVGMGGIQAYAGLAQAGLVGTAAAGTGAAAAGGAGAAGAAAGGGALAAIKAAALPVATALAWVAAAAVAVYLAYDQAKKAIPELMVYWKGDQKAKHEAAIREVTAIDDTIMRYGALQTEMSLLEAQFGAAAASEFWTKMADWQQERDMEETRAKISKEVGAQQTARMESSLGGLMQGQAGVIRSGIAAQDKAAAAEKKRKGKHPGGRGATRIQKVEIVVTSNKSPSRIARDVTDELTKLSRNARSSPSVSNYSALTRPGGGL